MHRFFVRLFIIILAALSMAGEKYEYIIGFKDPPTKMEFVLVKGGCFQMGSEAEDADRDERPVHEVCVDHFYMGKYEVTQGQWKGIMGDNPSFFKKCGDNCPVENVNWNDAQEFINRLNRKTVNKYRLPTEAEWEYAAKSGGKSEKWSGTSNGLELKDFIWYGKNSGSKTHPAGQKKPNGLGLYDMSGNVWEWVQDKYDEDAYRKHASNNPVYEMTGNRRVVRGGSWLDNNPQILRTANRGNDFPASTTNEIGFRLVRMP